MPIHEDVHRRSNNLLRSVRQAGTSEADNTRAERLAALNAAARRATDADELRLFMDMLGITPAMLGEVD